jgi:hypothetical protein
MIHHQNADSMGLASTFMRDFTPSQTRTGEVHGVSILMTNYGYAKIIGKSYEKPRIGLLYSLF